MSSYYSIDPIRINRALTNLNETVDVLLLPLLLEQLEEDDVEERARGQTLQRDHLGALHLLLPRHRLRQRDPDADPDRREQGERALREFEYG